MHQALNGQSWQPSDAVKFEVPQIAENGAIVPISVESIVPNTRRILIFAEKNPRPFLAEFQLETGADPWVSLRVKLNESGPVLAIVDADGQYSGTQKPVRVMVGGCG
jgi:sulfur-oxidizing protein SoxY